MHEVDLSLFQSVERIGSDNENHDKVTNDRYISWRNELLCSRAAKCLEISPQSATFPPSIGKSNERRGDNKTLRGNSHRHRSTGYGNIAADRNRNEDRKNRGWSRWAGNVSRIRLRERWEIATKSDQNRWYRWCNNEGPPKGLSSKWIYNTVWLIILDEIDRVFSCLFLGRENLYVSPVQHSTQVY